MSIDKIDQEIQDALDNNLHQKSIDEDAKAYQSLYSVLSDTSTEDYLPSNFADKVVNRVKPSKSDSEAFWWIGSMILFMLVTGLIVVALMMGNMDIKGIDFIAKYSPIMILITVVIGGVQWLDKKLVRLQV